MSNRKNKKFLKTVLMANGRCSCGKPNLSDVVEPTSKPKLSIQKSKPSDSSSSPKDKSGGLSIEDEYCSSTTVSLNIESSPHPSDREFDPKCTKFPSPRTLITNSIAVEKVSDDPYEDFKNSMILMVTEKQIYSKNGLQELLSCFLDLNSPNLHGVIIKAFSEILTVIDSHTLISSEQP